RLDGLGIQARKLLPSVELIHLPKPQLSNEKEISQGRVSWQSRRTHFRDGAVGFIDWLDALGEPTAGFQLQNYCCERKSLSVSIDFSKTAGDKISCMWSTLGIIVTGISFPAFFNTSANRLG